MKTKANGRKFSESGLVRAVLYRRTSTERQAAVEKVSPEKQLEECETYSRERGYTIVGVYSDIERYRVRGRWVEPTGERADRPGFQAMLADGYAGQYDVIVAWKEDRLYRGVKAAVPMGELLESKPVVVALVKEAFDPKMLYIKAAMGKVELQNIKERTMMGKRGQAERGYYSGGRVPHGYVAVKSGAGRTVNYELDPAYRDFFDTLARLFLARHSYQSIADQLGTNPVSGLRWRAGVIRFLVSNPFYRGLIQYGRWADADAPAYPAVHAPAWDAATCRAIEAEMARRAEAGSAGPRDREALFAGIARCGICGRYLATGRQVYHGVNGVRRYRFYGCYRDYYIRQGYLTGQPHGANFISEPKLLKLVRESFRHLTAADVDAFLAGLVLDGAAQAHDAERELRLRAELDGVEARLADLTIGLDGVRHASPAATEAVLTEMRRTGQHADRLRADLANLERKKRAGPDLAAARATMLQFIEHPEHWSEPTDQLRPQLQRMLPGLWVRKGELVPPVAEWD